MSAPTIVSGNMSGVDAGNTTSTVATLAPGGVADGDTVYVLIDSDPPSQTFTAPSGFSTIYSNVDIPSTSPTATFAGFAKSGITLGSETFDGTNYVFSVAVGTSERQAWFCFAVHGDGGIGAIATNNTGNSATATLPSITTTGANSLVVAFLATDGVSTPHGTATGYTKMGEQSGTSAPSLSVFYQTVTTAGTVIASQNVTLTSEQWLCGVFEIKQVGGLVYPFRMDGLGVFFRGLDN